APRLRQRGHALPERGHLDAQGGSGRTRVLDVRRRPRRLLIMRAPRHRRWMLALAGLLLSASARAAVDPFSTCDASDPTAIQWQRPTTGANTTATAPVFDTGFPGVTTPATYFAQGRQLMKFRSSDGFKQFGWCPPDGNCAVGTTSITNTPALFPMST